MREPAKLKFLESHEWIDVQGETATIGISDFAQKEISDIVFIELPKIGAKLKQKDSCMVVESVKAAFDIYAPASGEVTEVNTRLSANPEIVNQSPYEEGWFFKIKLSEASELSALMDYAAYDQTKQKAH